MSSDVILVLVIGTALAFDFTNGFHDTANVVATSISTGAARPQVAIAVPPLLTFVGAFISISVAATVANDVVNAAAITPTIVFAGLIGAIAWNLVTWYFGLPSSSSPALIGGGVPRDPRRRAAWQGADPGRGRATAGVPGRRGVDRALLPDHRQTATGDRQSRLPIRAGALPA